MFLLHPVHLPYDRIQVSHKYFLTAGSGLSNPASMAICISAIKNVDFSLFFQYFQGLLNPHDLLELYFIMEIHIYIPCIT